MQVDWQYLLMNPNGRISQRDYWIGVLVLVVGNVLAGMIPLLGGLLWLFLIWVGLCVYGKRLHDFGRSAWVHAIPWALRLIAWFIGVIVFGGALLAMALSGGEMSPWAMLSAGGSMAALFGLIELVWICYTVWVGVTAGQSGANLYGPAPVRVLDAAPPSAD